MSLLIEADSICKEYVISKKHIQVLNGASLSVKEGESVAVIGKSGAGKSTLLHILGGLDKPENGKVHVMGDDVYSLSPAARTKIRGEKIGFVFQSYHLLPEMDVLENVMLPAMAISHAGQPGFNARKRALELLDAVELADRSNHTPMELSGGEQQRVALARALMNDPQVVLADEPTGNLDDVTGGHVLDLLFALTQKTGHTLVLVTHNDKIAQSCDRVLRLDKGMITSA